MLMLQRVSVWYVALPGETHSLASVKLLALGSLPFITTTKTRQPTAACRLVQSSLAVSETITLVPA